MAALLSPIPSGPPHTLSEDEPFVFRARGRTWFVLVCFRRRWVLFDVSGTTRVDARPVEGGATTLSDGRLMTAGGQRLRLTAGGHRAELVHCTTRALCSYCREELAVEAPEAAARCLHCRRVQHLACARASKACGRCLRTLHLEVAP